MSVLRRAGSFCRPGNLRLLAGKAAHGFDYFNIDYRLPGGFSLPPKSVCLILSEKCNLRCRMCDIGGRGGSGASGMVRSIGSGAAAMGIRDWLAVLDDLAAFTPRPLVLLTGTEPLVSPHAEAVIAGVAERGLPLHITTNGALLERHARFIAEQCRRSVAADIAVSLDGPPAVHDDIRGVPGTYAAAVRGMQAVAAAREKLGSRFPRLSITCTVSNHNIAHLESLAAGIAELGLPVDAMTFNHLWFKDERIAREHNRRHGAVYPVACDNSGGVDLQSIHMKAVHDGLKLIRERFSGRYRIHEFPELTRAEADAYYGDTCRFVFYDRCTAPWRNVAVTPRGSVILSPLCFFGGVGNVQGARFHELWNGARMRDLRRLLKRQRAFPACSRCCMLFGSRPKWYKVKDWIR